MNTAVLDPCTGHSLRTKFAPGEIYERVHAACHAPLQRALERTDFWIGTYEGQPFIALHTRDSKDAQELIEGAAGLAAQLQNRIGSCYLGIYLDEDWIFFEEYPQVMNQHIMTHCYPHKGGPMFRRILNHFARRHAAQQRSEIHAMQLDQTALWNERTRLLDRLNLRERQIEALKKENLELQQRLAVMEAELKAKRNAEVRHPSRIVGGARPQDMGTSK